MKKLIPALAMLLVAAALMGTSTYAWFSTNKNVTASGMSVKAASDGGLGIASYTAENSTPASTAFVTNATVEWNNHKNITNPTINPTSLNNGTWYTAKATNVNEYTGSDYGTTADITSYANLSRWQIKSLAESGTGVALKVASITIENAADAGKDESKALNNAIRVALRVGTRTYKEDGSFDKWADGDQWFYFAPTYASGTKVYFTQAAGATYSRVENTNVKLGTVVTDDAANTVTSTYSNTVIYNALTTTPIDVEVYVYYEGEDENCKSSNAFSVDTLTVTVEYTVA